jgi:hypothetical protein
MKKIIMMSCTFLVYEGIEEALGYARDEETCRMVIPALEQILEGGR